MPVNLVARIPPLVMALTLFSLGARLLSQNPSIRRRAHASKSCAFNQEEVGVGLGDDMTDGAHKHETQARMKDPFMMNGDRYRTQRIKVHRPGNFNGKLPLLHH
jgi:hypothetical protein